jgi:hypothetical protein
MRTDAQSLLTGLHSEPFINMQAIAGIMDRSRRKI